MDEDTATWLSGAIDKMAQRQHEYENRAFLLAMKKVVTEQNERMNQLRGEVDGRLWNHEQW